MRTLILALSLLAAPAFADPLPLPAGYPTLLGASCGGVHTSSFVTGFDADGNISGEVYAWTRCGGSGRGGGYKSTIYQSWHSITWSLDAQTFVVHDYDGVLPDPDFNATDDWANYISNICYGVTNGVPACDADAVIVYVPPAAPPVAGILPDTRGMTEAAAMAAISAQGFVPYATYAAIGTPGVVFNQAPLPAKQGAPGSPVHLYVGAKKAD